MRMMVHWPRKVTVGELRSGHIWDLFRRWAQQNLVTLGCLRAKGKWIVQDGARGNFLPGAGIHCRIKYWRRNGFRNSKEIYRAAIGQERFCWGPSLPLLPRGFVIILSSLCQLPQNVKSWNTHSYIIQDGCEDEVREHTWQCLGHGRHWSNILLLHLLSSCQLWVCDSTDTLEYISICRDGLRDKG